MDILKTRPVSYSIFLKPCKQKDETVVKAAIKIQKTFRRFLSRKSAKKLKNQKVKSNFRCSKLFHTITNIFVFYLAFSRRSFLSGSILKPLFNPVIKKTRNYIPSSYCSSLEKFPVISTHIAHGLNFFGQLKELWSLEQELYSCERNKLPKDLSERLPETLDQLKKQTSLNIKYLQFEKALAIHRVLKNHLSLDSYLVKNNDYLTKKSLLDDLESSQLPSSLKELREIKNLKLDYYGSDISLIAPFMEYATHLKKVSTPWLSSTENAEQINLVLKAIPHLEKVSLKGNLSFINTNLENLSQLKEVFIQLEEFTTQDIYKLNMIMRSSKMKECNLIISIKDSESQILQEAFDLLITLPQLKKISVCYGKFSLEILPKEAKAKLLADRSFQEKKTDIQKFSTLTHSLKFKSLSFFIDLPNINTEVSQAIIENFSHLSNLKNFRLTIGSSKDWNTTIHLEINSDRNEALLSTKFLNFRNLETFETIRKIPQIQNFNLSILLESLAPSYVEGVLNTLASLSNLKKVYLNDCGIRSENMRSILELVLNNPHLELISLTENPINKAYCNLLVEKTKSHPSLKHIHLPTCT